MTEICVGSSSEVCEPSTRAARRRRMEIRRFKFVAGAESMASSDELRRKNRNREVVTDKNSDDDDDESSSNPEGSDQGPSSVESGEAEQWPRYGMTSVCGRRRDMEDAVSIRPDFLKASRKHHFFGVFDGHGCSHVADSCRDRMHEIVAAEMESTSSRPSWKEAMEKGFERMDAEVVASPGGSEENPNCRCELQTPKCDHVGSTAVVAVVSSDRIVVANCGDSRAVLGRKGAVVPLSVDHKPDRPEELERINAAGGRVIYWDGPRVLGVLAMSRAIGDSYLKPFVISEPEVTITERTEDDECLILASDGLWDVVSDKTACDVVRMCLRGNVPAGKGDGDGSRDSDKACSDAAMLLTKLALARQSADNVSVVVVDLRRNL